jgi:hypothetical protein
MQYRGGPDDRFGLKLGYVPGATTTSTKASKPGQYV